MLHPTIDDPGKVMEPSSHFLEGEMDKTSGTFDL